MFVFRRGEWLPVNLPFSAATDPLLSESHLQFAAAAAGAAMARGASQQAAEQYAEKCLYERLYPELGRVARKEHHAPKNNEKEGRVEEEPKGRGAATTVSNG